VREGQTSGTVTVLFTDLVGSTEGRVRLGEEAAEVVRRTHDGILAAAVEAHDGEVVKHLGDGIMAVFTGAADALSAAVAAQRGLDRYNRAGRGPERFDVRVGLSAGDVSFEEGDVFGTPVIEAARLCAAARGGQILTTEVVRALAGSRGGHRYIPVGTVELKGLPAPVPAVEVMWEAVGPPVALPLALRRTGSFQFVAREAEVEVLARAWKEAAVGERRVVFVAGEAGVGKTRLAAEATRRFHAEGAVVLFGRCEEELGIPYQPLAEALAEYAAAAPPEDLSSQLGPLGGELVRLVPALRDRVSGLAAPLAAEPETERYRLFEAVRELVTRIADTAPVVLLLDDLHWAARPTLALLTHAVRRLESARLLVIGTYRDTDLDRTHPLAEVLAELRRLPGTERLALTGLDEGGVVRFVETLTGHDLEGDMLALTKAVWSETEGNPFFVGEVLRHLVETGAIAEVDGRWRVVRPLTEVGIPEGVREVIGRRLSRLSEAANDVLATAAVIGREFDVGLLAEAAGEGSDVVLDAVEQAETARLVVPRTGRPGVYLFAHALVRSTLYDELPSTGRLRLHRRVGLALEHRVGAALPELAHHFVEAAPLGEAPRAVDYAWQAGERARQGLAFEEAVTHYERALETLELFGGADVARRCDLRIALGDTLHHARDRRYRKVLAAAAEDARTLPDAQRLARVAIVHNLMGFARPVGRTDDAVVALCQEALDALPPTDAPLRARLLAVLGLELAWSPESERRRTLLADALSMARRLEDRRVLADVLAMHRWADTDPDDHVARLAGADELIVLGEELGDDEAICKGHMGRVLVHYQQGDVRATVADIEAAASFLDRLRAPVQRAEVAGGRTMNALLLGDLVDAERLMAHERDLGMDAAMPPRTVVAHFVTQRFLLRYEQGRPQDALEELQQLAGFAEESGTARWGWQAMFGLAHLEATDEARAARFLDEIAAPGFSSYLRNATWLGGMAAAGRLAAGLGDRERAR
jgi:class 3 adenylate cyclase